MLLTNQRLDKLASARVDFAHRGMLKGICLSDAILANGVRTLSCNDLRVTITYYLGNDPPILPPEALNAYESGSDEDGDVTGSKVLARTRMSRKIRKCLQILSPAV
jgi:hypothetical protein